MNTWITLTVLTDEGTYDLELTFNEAVRCMAQIAHKLAHDLGPEDAAPLLKVA